MGATSRLASISICRGGVTSRREDEPSIERVSVVKSHRLATLARGRLSPVSRCSGYHAGGEAFLDTVRQN